MTRVPWPGLDTIASPPPTAASRSRMLVRPTPPFTRRESKPAPSSRTSQPQRAVVGQVDHHGGRAGGVLGGVLHRLQAAEVHRALDLGRIAPDAGGEHGRGQRVAQRRRAQRLDQAALGERRAGRSPCVSARSSSSACSTSSASRRITAALAVVVGVLLGGELRA